MKKIRNILFVLAMLCASFASVSCAADVPFGRKNSKNTATFSKQYLFIGDSITNGHGNTSLEAYPHQVSLMLGANSYKFPENFVTPSGWLTQNASGTLVVNHGLESQKIQTMLANVQTQVGDRLPDADETIVVLLGGINDIGQGATAAAVQADWTAYGAWCDANKVKLYIATMPAVSHPTFNAVRIEANNWLRANWQNFADELIDFERNEALADSTNTTYFHPDQVHPTAAGDYRMGEIVYSKINDSFQAPRIVRTTLPVGGFGISYNQTLTATGGDGAVTWSHRSGTLPPGIGFSPATQTFYGTAFVIGSYPNIVVRATDATGDFDEKTYTLTVSRKIKTCAGGVRTCINIILNR